MSFPGMCIIFWESGFNTKAVKSENANGSNSYGLFQISDQMWCQSDRKENNTNVCGQNCESKSKTEVTASCIRTLFLQLMLTTISTMTWNVLLSYTQYKDLRLGEYFEVRKLLRKVDNVLQGFIWNKVQRTSESRLPPWMQAYQKYDHEAHLSDDHHWWSFNQTTYAIEQKC